MRRLDLQTVRKGLFALMMMLVLLSLIAPAFAQTSTTTTQGGGSAQQQTSSQREVTTTTTTHTEAMRIDPLWLVLGGIALFAILLLVILAARGRTADHTHVHERTTVIKE